MRKVAGFFFFWLLISATTALAEKKLIVYSGITMLRPMTEIASIIEEKEKCQIMVVRGGSGELMKKFLQFRDGDLFIGGSESYIRQLKEKEADLVVDSRMVGHNWASMMVAKGNPKGIAPDLASLADSRYAVVIGDPKQGSIGRETKKILERKGIYEGVLQNARSQTRDSEGLINALRHGQADVVINWNAVATWPENASIVDTLPIDGKLAEKEELHLAQLKTSRHPEIARAFLDYAASAEGKEIFRKHGLFFQ